MIDLIGRRFERLIAIEIVGEQYGSCLWRVRCDCGAEKIINGRNLRNGQTRSCGCLSREIAATRQKEKTKHGEASSPSPEYVAWISMKTRCYNPKAAKYHLYGGRGITVCARWRESFETFLADMGRRPTAQHSLDRYPDTNGNYEKDNCRWATASEQNSNRRSYRR